MAAPSHGSAEDHSRRGSESSGPDRYRLALKSCSSSDLASRHRIAAVAHTGWLERREPDMADCARYVPTGRESRPLAKLGMAGCRPSETIAGRSVTDRHRPEVEIPPGLLINLSRRQTEVLASSSTGWSGCRTSCELSIGCPLGPEAGSSGCEFSLVPRRTEWTFIRRRVESGSCARC